ALAKVTAEKGKRYISHIRSEDRYFEKALEELIEIGRQAKLPVQVSHMKLATVSLWGKAGEVLAKLDKARAEGVDVTADVYPYTYWQSTMSVLFPERDFDNRESASFALRERAPPETFIIADFDAEPSYVGKTLVQVAKERKSDPVTALMDL